MGSPLAELIHHPGLFNSVFNVDASKQLQTERISTLPAKMAFPSNLFLAISGLRANPYDARSITKGHNMSNNVSAFLRASRQKFSGLFRSSLQKHISRSFTAGSANIQISRPSMNKEGAGCCSTLPPAGKGMHRPRRLPKNRIA